MFIVIIALKSSNSYFYNFYRVYFSNRFQSTRYVDVWASDSFGFLKLDRRSPCFAIPGSITRQLIQEDIAEVMTERSFSIMFLRYGNKEKEINCLLAV